MGFWKVVKMYFYVIGWLVLLFLILIMEGYDLVLFGNLYVFDKFNEKYGVYVVFEDLYCVLVLWQLVLFNGV